MITVRVNDCNVGCDIDCSAPEILTLTAEQLFVKWFMPAIDIMKKRIVENTLLGAEGLELDKMTPTPLLEADVLSIVVILNQDTKMWHVFEGTCKPKEHTFKVVRPIQTFPANSGNVNRPSTQVLNFVAAAAQAANLPVWIP